MTGPQDTTGATERPAALTAAGGTARERRPDIERFLDYLQETRGLSRNTMAAYGNDLRQYADYLGEQGVVGWDVPVITVSGFLEMLISREYAASSQARKLAAVKAMYRYLVEEGVVGSDPSKDIGGARVTKKRPNIISVGEADRLLAAASSTSTPEGYRDSAMLELLYGTGMRVSEIVALDSIDIDIDRLMVNCGRGTNRERKIPFGPRVVQALGRYMRGARDKLLGVRTATALFLNHRGRRLTRQGFWLIIKGHARSAEIDSTITPHTLRHSFATHRLRNDGTIPEVQSVLGHASPATTQIYLELAHEKGAAGVLPGSQSRSSD